MREGVNVHILAPNGKFSMGSKCGCLLGPDKGWVIIRQEEGMETGEPSMSALAARHHVGLGITGLSSLIREGGDLAFFQCNSFIFIYCQFV